MLYDPSEGERPSVTQFIGLGTSTLLGTAASFRSFFSQSSLLGYFRHAPDVIIGGKENVSEFSWTRKKGKCDPPQWSRGHI